MSAIWSFSASFSMIVGGNVGGNFDDGIQPADYRRTLPNSYEVTDQEIDVDWPRSSFRGGMGAAIENMQNIWEYNYPPTGHHRPKKVSGITKDSAGSPLAACTVMLFNTATNLFVDTVVSDGLGAYELSDPNNVACFVVADKAGGTEVAGVTNNNLTGV